MALFSFHAAEAAALCLQKRVNQTDRKYIGHIPNTSAKDRWENTHIGKCHSNEISEIYSKKRVGNILISKGSSNDKEISC